MIGKREATEAGSLTLHLLDSAHGRTIQSWRFNGRNQIKIGRAPDNDITIADPQVSRCHVELTFCDGHWLLQSRGRNGTHVNGEDVSQLRLSNNLVFQLGSSGPTFKFALLHDSVTSLATMDDIDPTALDFLELDEQQKQQEVEKIADGEIFQQLRQQARSLKEQRNEEHNQG